MAVVGIISDTLVCGRTRHLAAIDAAATSRILSTSLPSSDDEILTRHSLFALGYRGRVGDPCPPARPRGRRLHRSCRPGRNGSAITAARSCDSESPRPVWTATPSIRLCGWTAVRRNSPWGGHCARLAALFSRGESTSSLPACCRHPPLRSDDLHVLCECTGCVLLVECVWQCCPSRSAPLPSYTTDRRLGPSHDFERSSHP